MIDVARQVERVSRLLGDHLAAAVQTFGSAALGVIDLPPLVESGRLNAPQLRAAATLFWCMNVEGAGLPGFVDALAQAAWEGRMPLPGSRIIDYWRGREDRFSVEERRAIYERLFGPESGFPAQWSALVDGLCELGGLPLEVGAAGHIARVSMAALELGQALSDRAVGIVGFAGREIVAHVRAALDVLRDGELVTALGGGGVWQIVRRHSPLVLGRIVDPTPFVDRAGAGLTILEWVAARAAALESGAVIVGREDPIVRAAEAWRAAA